MDAAQVAAQQEQKAYAEQEAKMQAQQQEQAQMQQQEQAQALQQQQQQQAIQQQQQQQQQQPPPPPKQALQLGGPAAPVEHTGGPTQAPPAGPAVLPGAVGDVPYVYNDKQYLPSRASSKGYPIVWLFADNKTSDPLYFGFQSADGVMHVYNEIKPHSVTRQQAFGTPVSHAACSLLPSFPAAFHLLELVTNRTCAVCCVPSYICVLGVPSIGLCLCGRRHGVLTPMCTQEMSFGPCWLPISARWQYSPLRSRRITSGFRFSPAPKGRSGPLSPPIGERARVAGGPRSLLVRGSGMDVQIRDAGETLYAT